MKITELLQKNTIKIKGEANDKKDVLDQMFSLIQNSSAITDMESYKNAVWERESLGSTGIGDGIAIPHAKTPAVSRPALAAMTIPNGAEYDSLDGNPVNLIFLIAAPDTEDNIHLEVLSRLSVLLMDASFRSNLLNSKTPEEFLSVIDEAEKEKVTIENEKNSVSKDSHYQILAVTACPTGIAHTYMAAESLEKEAEVEGVSIKVETDGSGGVKNKLTQDEIEHANAIIVAADKAVEMSRFNGKKVLVTKVSDGIKKPKELIERALSGELPIYHSSETNQEAANGMTKESAGRKIYKYLMDGVSHMLPFVIAGGILMALSFAFDNSNPNPETFGVGNPFSSFLNHVGHLAFDLMLPILAAYIAMAIGDRPALMVGFVGGLMAKEGLAFNTFGKEAGDWVSAGFFGALLAGFIAGYLMIGIKKLLSRLPKALEGTKPILLYPILGILGISVIMFFLIDPPMAAFNTALNGLLSSMGEGSRVLLGVVLGAMMAIDFGGPLNKAAYVFGTASILSGQTSIMAAVMIGGMVPPLAIALATTFFKNRFTKAERQTTVTNYIMGLSFITEGAIPFAAAHPLQIIPACAIGSAVAGGLSMFFGCQLPAPHGGIFVIGIITNPFYYLLSLVIGSIVGMVVLGLIKKPVDPVTGLEIEKKKQFV